MEKQKIKQFFTVKMEVMAPVELTFKVLAEDPKQALEIAEKIPPPPLLAPPKPKISKMRKIKATVYKYGTVMVYFVKNYIG